jgi:hypothetical protein
MCVAMVAMGTHPFIDMPRWSGGHAVSAWPYSL